MTPTITTFGWVPERAGKLIPVQPASRMRALQRVVAAPQSRAMADPDREAARRAMETMMGMRRIDIAAIERAHAGLPAP